MSTKPDKKENVIIGVSFGYHDASCCIIKNGELVASAQEERFTRIKHDSSAPVNAFRYCLEAAGVDVQDVDALAYYEEPYDKISRQIWMGLQKNNSSERMRGIAGILLDSKKFEREINEKLGYQGDIHFIKHHLSHGASSFYFSGYEDADILTVDGVGEWQCMTYGYADRDDINIFESVDFPDSIGLLYSAITSYLGFEVNDGEYKVMGLAPYGEANQVDKIYQIIEEHRDGSFKLKDEYFSYVTDDAMYSEKMEELFGYKGRTPESKLLQFHMDMAKSIQVVIEELLFEKAMYIYKKHPSNNLCLAGGVALNCVAVGKLHKDGPFKNVFVQPAAGDAGGAIGAAAYIYKKLFGGHIQPLKNAYLGPEYSSDYILNILDEASVNYLDFRSKEAEMLDYVSDKLVDGNVIGWFHGRMEFGPRALGARSIIADPRKEDMRDRINGMVKLRESFRPFAPSVLSHKVQEHFSIDYESPYMLETCQVTSDLELPAITHVDGSGRLQTVTEEDNGRYARLIQKFDEKTGCPLVLNTSFNMRGEPIVCSPIDAIKCFIRSKMDVLVLEDYILLKEDIPEIWLYFAGREKIKKSNVNSMVYTLL
ncbi:carbamoyltransferase [Kineothrix alysoides]|uniref:Carbamoyltransferase n=1 Tax=Kineothrix alysoides TaxID=1469948 RepID=A0A4R1QWC2_9FIRM|nr:carbamoyltransferase N-terminal domain-containing protein [Kineothrix alysoides]TCL57601.1 carbamoyltransferase [Kineothrix alysoides]